MVYRLQKQQRYYVFLLVFLAFVFLFWILYGDNISVSNGDVLSQSSYFENLVKGNLKEGLSLWNPYIYSGTVFLGNPLSSLFYPLNLLNYVLPYVVSYKIIVFISLFLSSLFMFFYLRTIKRSNFASFFGAVSYSYSGMFVTWLFIPSFVSVILWFPLIILLIELMITKEKYYYGVFLSLLFAAQILSGGLQVFFYSTFIAILYFALRIFYLNKRAKQKFVIRQSKYLFLFLLLSAILSSLFLLPIFEFGSQSIRSGGVSFEDASLHSIPLYGFVNLIMPNFFGNPSRGDYWAFWKGASFSELTVYLGIAALLFTLVALIFFRDRYVKIFCVIALFSLLFALGKNFLLFKFIYSSIPGFDLFRVPARMMIFFIFSLCVMASIGLDYFISRKLNKKSFYRFLRINYILIGLSFFAFLIMLIFKTKILSFGGGLLERVYYANLNTSRVGGQDISFFISKIPLVYREILLSIIFFTFIYFLFIFILDLKLNKKITLKRFKVFFVLLLIFDLWVFSAGLIRAESYSNLYARSDVLDFLKDNSGIERVVYLRDPVVKSTLFPSAYLTVKDQIYRIDGCEGIAIDIYSRFICGINNCTSQRQECVSINEIKNKNYLNLLNARYIVSRNEIEGYTQVFSGKDLYVYKNTEALPRAFVVHNYLVVEDSEKVLDLIGRKDFDPLYYVLFDEPVLYQTRLDGFDYGEYANITKYTPNRIELKAKLNHGGFLVLSEINYVGWDAFVDGKLMPILNADYMFRSVYLEPGEHRVAFEYRPASFRLGIYLSLLGAMTLLIMFIYLYLKRAKK